MGLHYEESGIVDGTIDNRTRGKTILKINFTNHTSSLITLQWDPCRDLAGSLWKFMNPFAEMEETRGDECYFIPSISEGFAGRISYSRKVKVGVLPPEEHLDMVFDDSRGNPPTKIAPMLELEWFTPKFGQVEIDCDRMTLELVEMVWTMTQQEADMEEEIVNDKREEILSKGAESGDGFMADMKLIEDYVADGPEPHELEERCFLIVQEFVVNSADGSEEKEALHGNLLKLQEQVGGAFGYLNHEGGFDDIPATIKLLNGVLPFIDRAADSANFAVAKTAELLGQFREGIVALRDELVRASEK